MGDRMTSAQARQAADKAYNYSATAAMRLREAADALEQYEAEDAARRAMPELRREWAVRDATGEVAFFADREAALREVERATKRYPFEGPFSAVRLAVVEVAEPEPPRPVPVREVGPSGWEYEVQDSRVMQIDHYGGQIVVTNPEMDMVPPADRALVARLLGEGG